MAYGSLTFKASAVFKVNTDALVEMNDPNGMIGMAVERAAQVTVQRAQNNMDSMGRVRTGFSRDNTRYEMESSPTHVRAKIGTDSDYWVYQELGTRRITPAPALQEALNELTDGDFAL